MPNAQLAKAINTPPPAVLQDLANSQIMDLGGLKVQALPLGEGGFGKTYLYKSKDEYRVAKVFHPGDMKYGHIERRIASFNKIYSTIYDKQLTTLATARAFNSSDTILDMPYIGGEEYFDFRDSREVYTKQVQELIFYFTQYGFFVSDYVSSGNITCFTDPESNMKYILVTDVDLVGRKDSYEQGGDESVTYAILKEAVPNDDIDQSEFFSVLTSEEEVKTEPSQFLTDFAEIQSLLLEKITAKHPKHAALAHATDFPELCFIAGQKRKKNWFSTEEGFTDVLDKLYDFVNDEKYQALKNHYQLPQEFTKYDLQEIGFYGKLRLKGDNIKLREKNLRYIYSIKLNNEEYKPHVDFLRNYSVFAADFKTLPDKHKPAQLAQGIFSLMRRK